MAADQQHRSLKERLYVHIDMNAFYAQVEQQSYNLHGMPVVVGGWRKKDGTIKGIVATSSYEARAWGIKTGMSALEAHKLCPFLIFRQVDYEKYRAISKRIKKALDTFSPDVEAYSMDEFFMDITWKKDSASYASLVEFGWSIKEAVYEETRLKCNVGISTSKTYSKLASDLEKPDGLTVLTTREEIKKRIWPLSLDEVWGIGRRRYAKLKKRGLHTIGEAVSRGYPLFQDLFGHYFGKMLWETAAGKDRARVSDETEYVPERVAYGHTFSTWTDKPWKVAGEFAKAVRQVCYRLRGYGKKSGKFHGFVRFQDADNRGFTFSFRTPGLTNLDSYVLEACLEEVVPILGYFKKRGETFRSIGLSTVELNMTDQGELFFSEGTETRRMYRAIDYLNNCFGWNTIYHGTTRLDVKGHTHFKERSI